MVAEVSRSEEHVTAPDHAAWRRFLADALLSPRSTDPPRRRPADLVVLLASLLGLLALAVRERPVEGFEVDLAQTLNELPLGAPGGAQVWLRIGSLWVVLLLASMGAIAGRRRLSAQVLVAGALAWAGGRAIVGWYGHQPLPEGVVGSSSRAFQELPLVRVALLAAITSAALPYLTRLARRLAVTSLVVASVLAVAIGAGLPSDVLAGLLLGWAAAALVQLTVGSPAGRPSLEQIEAALVEVGVAVGGLRFADEQQPGSTRVRGETADGTQVCVRAYGRDDRDAQLLAKAWRFAWYEDSGPTLYATRLQQVEHQAYAMLLAAGAGVPVADLAAATTAGPGTAVLVERRRPGTALAELAEHDDEALDDELLDGAWRVVARLRDARIAHGALDLEHLVRTDDGRVLLVDFDAATTSADGPKLDRDVANLLAATALAAGEERAVAAARRALPDEAIVGSLAYLQPPVLTDAVRAGYRRHRGRLGRVRAVAAKAAGAEAPPLVQLERVPPGRIAMVGATFVGIYGLLTQVGDVEALRDALGHADWGWVAVATVLAALTNVGYALAYVGSTTARLPFGRTVVLQAAGSFTNLVAPNGLGTAAINTRFLQVRGVAVPAALASLAASTVGSGLVQVAMFLVVAPAVGTHLDLSLIPWQGLLVAGTAAAVAVVLAAAVVWQVPRVRAQVGARLRVALDQLHNVVRSPGRLALIVGGQALVQVLYAASLGAACLAFGASSGFSTLLGVNIASSFLAGIVPAPGGLGVAEATLAGALTATGVPPTAAVAASLAYRLVGTWLPSVPGWVALRALQRGDDL